MGGRAEQLANSWRIRVTTISRNLMDLAETEMTKMVKVRMKDPSRAYNGVTLNYATQAIKSLDSLWESYLLLARVVDEAVHLAGRTGFLHDYSDEVIALLESESVVLPTNHIPITSRGLLSAADRVERVTPEVMIGSMEKLFMEARDIIVRISTADSTLQPRITAMSREITTLASWAKSLDVTLPTLTSDPSQLLERVERDPLGCANELDAIGAELTKARTLLHSLESEQRTVRKSLDEAKQTINRLSELIQLSTEAIMETQEKMLHAEGLMPPVSMEVITSLETWLHSLEENTHAGRYTAVKVGVAKLLKESAAQLVLAEQTYTQNRASLDEMENLRGMFKALYAKAKSYRERGLVLDGTIDQLAEQARQALQTKPFNLRASRQAVQAYNQALARLK